VGSASGAGGAFSMCFQHLASSRCVYTQPVGGFNLCNTFKVTYRGSSTQGVTHNITFTGVGGGASGSTSLSGSNLVSLSNPALALRYGGIYDVQADVNYALENGVGTVENILVAGSSASVNCNDIAIMAQPDVHVRTEQRCPASLLRSTYLNATRVGTASVCGAVNYTYQFTQVLSCNDGTTTGIPLTYTTTGTSPYLRLTVLPNLPNAGAWDVQVRPNFVYGSGTYGPVQRILVTGTSASGELVYETVDANKSIEEEIVEGSVYPNPTNGESVNVSLSGLKKGQLQVRVLDASGRAITTHVYPVENSLRTTLVFERKLSAGIYMIEMTNAGSIRIDRLIVQ